MKTEDVTDPIHVKINVKDQGPVKTNVTNRSHPNALNQGIFQFYYELYQSNFWGVDNLQFKSTTYLRKFYLERRDFDSILFLKCLKYFLILSELNT